MEVTEYFDTRPEAESYASGLRGCLVRVGHCRTPVRGYYVVATYKHKPLEEE